MIKKNFLKKLLVTACCATLLSACGGSGSDTPATTTTITGTAEAPNGTIAQLEYNKSFIVAVVENIFPAANAAITGLEPVTGATVELLRIDNGGNQIGSVLATTFTSITGDYSLVLPTGVSLAGNLIVRISSNSDFTLGAMVVEQAIDINPVSQYILNKFIDEDNLILADLAVNEIAELSGRVEDFDLTTTNDMTTMLAELESVVGQLVDNEIDVIESTPDNGSGVAGAIGNWHSFEIGFDLSDDENESYSHFGTQIISETFIFTSGTSPDVDTNVNVTTGPLLLDASTNLSFDNNGSVSIGHQFSITGDGDDEPIPVTIDFNGNILVSFPFDEDLETVTVGGPNDSNGDGPDFGWREPPVSDIFVSSISRNVYAFNINGGSVRYRTTDTDGDGIKDAIDPAQKDGDEVDFTLGLFLKEGSSMDASSILGEFGAVYFNINIDNTGGTVISKFDSSVGTVEFDGIDAVDRNTNSLNTREITRTPDLSSSPEYILTSLNSTEPDPAESLDYVVSPTGKVDITVDANEVLEGYANNDGSIIAFVADSVSGSPIVTTNQEMQVYVKLGSAMSSALNDSSYRMYMVGLNFNASGSTEVINLANGLITFNADSTSATVSGVDRGISRDTDIAALQKNTPETVSLDFSTSISANGAITMDNIDDSFTTTLEGYVSENSEIIILRLYGAEEATGVSYDIGMIVGVKQ